LIPLPEGAIFAAKTAVVTDERFDATALGPGEAA
jgi:hypothetical protein